MSIDRRSTRRAKPSGDGVSIEPKCGKQYHQTTKTSGDLERVEGIEPSWPAWKAGTLPLSYTRVNWDNHITDLPVGQPVEWPPTWRGLSARGFHSVPAPHQNAARRARSQRRGDSWNSKKTVPLRRSATGERPQRRTVWGAKTDCSSVGGLRPASSPGSRRRRRGWLFPWRAS